MVELAPPESRGSLGNGNTVIAPNSNLHAAWRDMNMIVHSKE
jgi:hypothetical protein